MKRVSLVWLAAAFLLAGVVHSQTADEIMRQVRSRQSEQQGQFKGKLRTGRNKVPFSLQIEGPTLRYSFQDPARVLQIRLGEKGSQLDEIVGGESGKVSPGRFDERLYDTEVTLEDISLQFLYWPNAEIIDAHEKDDGLPVRVIRLKPPGNNSQYGFVDLWVDKQGGGFTRAVGRDKEKKVIREFNLKQVQRVNGTWFIKEMRIHNPSTGTYTYLTIEKT